MELHNLCTRKKLNSAYGKDKDSCIKYEIFGFSNTSAELL